MESNCTRVKQNKINKRWNNKETHFSLVSVFSSCSKLKFDRSSNLWKLGYYERSLSTASSMKINLTTQRRSTVDWCCFYFSFQKPSKKRDENRRSENDMTSANKSCVPPFPWTNTWSSAGVSFVEQAGTEPAERWAGCWGRPEPRWLLRSGSSLWLQIQTHMKHVYTFISNSSV